MKMEMVILKHQAKAAKHKLEECRCTHEVSESEKQELREQLIQEQQARQELAKILIKQKKES